jgi:hypothetical protein
MKKTIIATLMLLSLSSFAGSGVGEISAGGMKDYANLTITGQAAKVIFDSMNDVASTSQRQGSLITTTKLGRDITCSLVAEVAMIYTCRLSIDSSGSANRNFQR